MSEQYVYGLHAVKALLGNPYRTIRKLYVSQERLDQKVQSILELAERRNVAVEKLNQQTMNQRFQAFTHQGLVAEATPVRDFNESDLKDLLSASQSPALILILDGVTDPHNLGACLRSADAAGVRFVMIPKDKSASITPVVSKVACGAAESVPLVRVTNLVRAMEIIKQEGVWIYGAAGEATQSLYQLDCRSSIALVMGAEGDGLRRLTREHCDGLFSLPMLGSVESLNVSVATGISLYEAVRQRQSGLQG
ncbi:23S rRNA (guanosine(2251)-2'-O)-methyltransferase RlmB [Legionella taurinensis]|uniref:23S rRNA (guanosine-2'-O-)-methyltransferase RlmB n=1 Tax=Legionella taurinensis TaxID=70611 RepID=A0A3A5L7Q1_9GAMM|nr:23S rRNA (guanosine(2251)-2'-O)-methyltransferase RlmB [Legionella taurinensis]MDX1836307.1 23S rRNA (guanosine(2251)-2'-O)-methyltransferase RlmB [Legionella taurinensis]PUT41939.1 23S rRNA (guanosine(2251)-2'-O)-methyltransferase RlmB [Legionella taurinensis]PUT44728.1 23S rRNA (guanosine(2251)-2'-O)-methyltransferase RlmB [Legionella taurinensis]PUT48048.1 23S rRNA (guanosine(2251)-2'-O)-methyltransferase RlmB [Legionella taurinensis]PUT48863.1 23S rRNA (guanosine(2251)-2'-O)-methyltrans